MEEANIAQVEGQENDVDTTLTTSQPQLTPEQIHNMQVWMRAAREAYGARCRKKGHVHLTRNPAGAKMARKLARQGSLYGRVTIVTEAFNNIQKRKFLENKEKACQEQEQKSLSQQQ